MEAQTLMALRVALALGLAFHKLVWEIMRTRVDPSTEGQRVDPSAEGQRGGTAAGRRTDGDPRKRALKLAKAAGLGFLVAQTLFLNLLPISKRPARLRAVGAILFFLGLAVAVAGRFQLGRNWANVEDLHSMPNRRLVKSGVYKHIRHPIYVGDTLLLVGLELALNSWLVLATGAPLAMFLRQASAEEAHLSDAVEGYDAYRKRTKGYVPFVV